MNFARQALEFLQTGESRSRVARVTRRVALALVCAGVALMIASVATRDHPASHVSGWSIWFGCLFLALATIAETFRVLWTGAAGTAPTDRHGQ